MTPEAPPQAHVWSKPRSSGKKCLKCRSWWGPDADEPLSNCPTLTGLFSTMHLVLDSEELLARYDVTWPYCGFEDLPGWMPLIERLIQDLIALGWDRRVDQVKEKFGGLRFYICEGSEEMHERIAVAEAESLKTCESCGAEGRRRGREAGRHWVKTLCDACEGRR